MATRPKTTTGLLELVGQPRIERYELLSESGFVVEVTHNLETGHTDHEWTDRRELSGDHSGA